MIDEKTQLGNGLHPSDEPFTPLRSAEGLPTGIREGNAGLLSLKDLEAQLGDGSSGFYGRLRRFADVPGIGELLGAVNVPGAKGVRYEPRSVDIFRRLLAASTANEVTPATAVAWLKLNKDVQPGDQAETAIAEKTQPGNSTDIGFATRLLSGALAPISAVLSSLTDAIQSMRADQQKLLAAPSPPPAPPPPDRLLNAEEAGYLLGCSPGTVRSRVKPVLRGRYRESDVLRFIEQLGTEQLGTEGKVAK